MFINCCLELQPRALKAFINKLPRKTQRQQTNNTDGLWLLTISSWQPPKIIKMLLCYLQNALALHAISATRDLNAVKGSETILSHDSLLSKTGRSYWSRRKQH
jgi:hypothetical protein